MTTHNCTRCGRPVKYRPNICYCPTCKTEARAEHRKRSIERLKEYRSAKVKAEARKPQDTKARIADAEQYRINREIDNKFNMPLHSKVYEYGTPEFMRVAQEIIQRRNVYA